MKIALVSWWRNSVGRVATYASQVAALRTHLGPDHTVRVVAVEGDSTDGTARRLMQERWQVETFNHGGPVFASTEQPERMKAMSKVLNCALESVSRDDEVVVLVESDLLWGAHDFGSLIDIAWRRDGNFDVIAPMVWAGPHFYDIWGFRKDGERFGPFKPYHKGLTARGKTLFELDSAGSCLVMRAPVARAVRVRNGNAFVGWCEEARARGYRIAVAPGFSVRHP